MSPRVNVTLDLIMDIYVVIHEEAFFVVVVRVRTVGTKIMME